MDKLYDEEMLELLQDEEFQRQVDRLQEVAVRFRRRHQLDAASHPDPAVRWVGGTWHLHLFSPKGLRTDASGERYWDCGVRWCISDDLSSVPDMSVDEIEFMDAQMRAHLEQELSALPRREWPMVQVSSDLPLGFWGDGSFREVRIDAGDSIGQLVGTLHTETLHTSSGPEVRYAATALYPYVGQQQFRWTEEFGEAVCLLVEEVWTSRESGAYDDLLWPLAEAEPSAALEETR